VIGLGLSPKGTRQPAIAIVTNCSEPQQKQNRFKHVNPLGRAFERYILDPPNVRHYVAIDGAVGVSATGKLAINGLRRKLQRELRDLPDGCDPRSVLDRLVTMLRLHRRQHQELSRVIGEYCVAAAIKSDFLSCADHTAQKAKRRSCQTSLEIEAFEAEASHRYNDRPHPPPIT
jgi:hypothetical protein